MSVVASRQGELLVLQIDNPPVNGLGYAVRRDLLDGLDQAVAEGVAAVVITGRAGSFSAGADIREFGTPRALLAPRLPDLCLEIEASPIPVIAAVQGVALGGGLELALACHYRVMHPEARLGLPEVRLGIIPGAGGTQRLPRLLGLEAAARMILTAESCAASSLQDTPLVQALVPSSNGGWLEAALASVRQGLAGAWGPAFRAPERPVPVADSETIERWNLFVRDCDPAIAAPSAAWQALRAACAGDWLAGLALERRLFLDLVQSPVSRALRHLFAVERGVAKDATFAAVRDRIVASLQPAASRTALTAPDSTDAWVRAAGLCLDEAIEGVTAARIDWVAVHDLGFPRHLGGPLFAAQEEGLHTVLRRLRRQPGPIPACLLRHVADGTALI
jgi:3-hydroxyacyl-CoA dehydrogenase